MRDVALRWERPTDEVLRPRGTEPCAGALACAANSPILTDTLSYPEGFSLDRTPHRVTSVHPELDLSAGGPAHGSLHQDVIKRGRSA